MREPRTTRAGQRESRSEWGVEEGKDRGMLTRAMERSAEWGLATVELDVAERLRLGRSERQGPGWVHSLHR